MGPTPWLMIIILVLVIVLGIGALVAAKTRKEKRPVDYYAFFWMGLIWTAIGLPLYQQGNFAFLGMGLVFLLVGLANRNKWEKNRVKWSDLDKNTKNLKLALIIGLTILLVLGIVFMLLTKKGMMGM